MSDERRRELERQAAIGGDEARARLLIERLRMNEVTPERLGLAAYLGDPAAGQVVGPLRRIGAARTREWGRGFAAFGREAQVRVAVAVARRVLPRWEEQGGAERVIGRRARVREAIEAAEAWIRTPCAELEDRAERASVLAKQTSLYDAVDEDARLAGHVAAFAAQATSTVTAGEETATTHYACASLERAVELVGHEVVEEAVAREVLPWALGDGDPVREPRDE